MSARVTVKMPNLKIEEPDKRFFGKVGFQLVDEIDRRTRSGLDVDRKGFKKYSAAYKKQTGKGKPDLNVTGQMLGAMGNGVKALAHGFKIRLSGQQGFKAWVNEEMGRKFFGMSKRQKDRIARAVTQYFTKKNKLKK